MSGGGVRWAVGLAGLWLAVAAVSAEEAEGAKPQPAPVRNFVFVLQEPGSQKEPERKPELKREEKELVAGGGETDGAEDGEAEEGGLSGAAVAGLVAGSLAGVAVLVALVVIVLMRRRRAAQSEDGGGEGAQPAAPFLASLRKHQEKADGLQYQRGRRLPDKEAVPSRSEKKTTEAGAATATAGSRPQETETGTRTTTEGAATTTESGSTSAAESCSLTTETTTMGPTRAVAASSALTDSNFYPFPGQAQPLRSASDQTAAGLSSDQPTNLAHTSTSANTAVHI